MYLIILKDMDETYIKPVYLKFKDDYYREYIFR